MLYIRGPSATPVLKAFWILHVKMGVSNSICAASPTNGLPLICSYEPGLNAERGIGSHPIMQNVSLTWKQIFPYYITAADHAPLMTYRPFTQLYFRIQFWISRPNPRFKLISKLFECVEYRIKFSYTGFVLLQWASGGFLKIKSQNLVVLGRHICWQWSIELYIIYIWRLKSILTALLQNAGGLYSMEYKVDI